MLQQTVSRWCGYKKNMP